MDSDLRNKLGKRFRHFALEEGYDSSPLYAVFALTVADHDELLELADYCRQHYAEIKSHDYYAARADE